MGCICSLACRNCKLAWRSRGACVVSRMELIAADHYSPPFSPPMGDAQARWRQYFVNRTKNDLVAREKTVTPSLRMDHGAFSGFPRNRIPSFSRWGVQAICARCVPQVVWTTSFVLRLLAFRVARYARRLVAVAVAL